MSAELLQSGHARLLCRHRHQHQPELSRADLCTRNVLCDFMKYSVIVFALILHARSAE